ncbi:3-phosphoserine/phosphohydroxythreonine transaminase [Gammaproteobacteria bacterium]|nr:3-phosphoserine/phosphohydroxythreonine transaminase [Gammaproteobacteria bacterium]
MSTRTWNFCAGPCTLPAIVLERMQTQLLDYQSSGMSLIEMSHRSASYEAVHQAAIDGLRRTLSIPDNFQILLLQGGAMAQFSMLPMNLLAADEAAAWIRSGQWGNKAQVEASAVCRADIAWDGKASDYLTMPTTADLDVTDDARFLHLTSNETISGMRVVDWPDVEIPLVIDASSDILTRALPWDRIGVVYAGAQKNLGTAGLGVVIVRDDLLEARRALPSYLQYAAHAKANSLLNTPPIFQVWMLSEMMRWVEECGGLAHFETEAAQKSGDLYSVIDGSDGFFTNPIPVALRSMTNIVFRLPSDELQASFLKAAEAANLTNLKGHRSVGGCRASLYNGMAPQGAAALADFMQDFARRAG